MNNEKDILFSIIIPVYKVEKYIKECVESVLNQSYKSFEIILVDDGSPDNCPKICDEMAKNNKEISVIHKKNGGLSSARNEGIKNAKGRYILCIDSDDYLEKNDCLMKITQKIEERNPDVVLINYKKLVESTGKEIIALPQEKEFRILSDNDLDRLVSNGVYMSSACHKVVNRKMLIDNKIDFVEGVISEDVEWSAKILLHCKNIEYLDDCFYIYRQRNNSITASYSIKSLSDVSKNFSSCMELIEREKKEDSDIYKTYMKYMSYQYAVMLIASNVLNYKDIKSILFNMKKYSFVLNYSTLKKTRIIKIIYKISGIMGVRFVSKIYAKYLYNKVSVK